jgi:hypothetical protein
MFYQGKANSLHAAIQQCDVLGKTAGTGTSLYAAVMAGSRFTTMLRHRERSEAILALNESLKSREAR